MTAEPDDAPSPQDPNRAGPERAAPLDAGPDATPTDDTTDPEDAVDSLPPGASTKPE